MRNSQHRFTNDGNAMPAIGFGVWQSRGDELIGAVQCALDAGYRLVDTAAIYGNESEVGSAIKLRACAGKIYSSPPSYGTTGMTTLRTPSTKA